MASTPPLLAAYDAGGEVDDAAAVVQPAACLADTVEGTGEVDGDVPLEGGIIHLGQRDERHHAGIVDEDVGAAEMLFRSVEQRGDAGRCADIRLHGERLAAGRFNLRDHLVCGRRA